MSAIHSDPAGHENYIESLVSTFLFTEHISFTTLRLQTNQTSQIYSSTTTPNFYPLTFAMATYSQTVPSYPMTVPTP
jgi:hypothetical protein